MADGHTSAEAISELESLRTSRGMTMSQLHAFLQPKKVNSTATT
jgi:hypothetical protein